MEATSGVEGRKVGSLVRVGYRNRRGTNIPCASCASAAVTCPRRHHSTFTVWVEIHAMTLYMNFRSEFYVSILWDQHGSVKHLEADKAWRHS